MSSGIHPRELAPGAADDDFWLEAILAVQYERHAQAQRAQHGDDDKAWNEV